MLCRRSCVESTPSGGQIDVRFRLGCNVSNRFILTLLLMMLVASPKVIASSWSLSVSDKDGLPLLAKGGATAISANYAFWAGSWKWADQRTEFKTSAPFDYSIAGRNESLNFDLSVHIKKRSDRQMIWQFDLNALRPVPDAIGGGIVFKFDLGNFGREMGEPQLLPNNQGWSWGRSGREHMEMRFDPPLASVNFERGQKDEIRAFFYKGRVPTGLLRHTAIVNLYGDMQFVPNSGERFGLVDIGSWQTGIIDQATSPIDLSFLNKPERPAGKRGFLKVVKDKLTFEDGTRTRFWGTNLTAYALYGTTKEDAKRQARRLSELGFNLVRLHHHDSFWVDPNIFGDQKGTDTQSLSSAMLDKLDWWIKCLKDEGIYIWLDLHVARNMKPDDQIEGFDEIRKGQPAADLKGYNYVNPSIQRAMQRFNEAYVNHRNNYTGLRNKEEPAIAALLITNENDLTNHYGNALLGDKGVPKHNALYLTQAEAFAAKYRLPKEKVWRSWEHGPSKLFLNDLEHRFDVAMIAHLRSLGVKVPIVTTSTWGDNPLSSLPALTAGDVIDAHAYGGVEELGKNPAYAPSLVHWLAAAQVAGKPLSVSEWNVEAFPAPDRHTIPLYVASSASMQGWDALMQYAYAQEGFPNQGTPSNWHSYNDPTLIATLPAAALLYRQAHVREATTTYAFVPGKEGLFSQQISAKNSVALRTAAEKGKLLIVMPQTTELPWLEKGVVPAGAKILTDPQQSLIALDAEEVVSDSGELKRNWEQGIFTINTPMTQAAMGWIGAKKISLTDVEITATTRNATVAVQSLDGKTIAESSRILISLGARSVPQAGNRLPFHSEIVEGKLIIRARKGLKLSIANVQAQGGTPKSGNAKEGRSATQSSTIAFFENELESRKAKLLEMSGNWGPNHPAYLLIQAEIAELEAKVGLEKQSNANRLPDTGLARTDVRSSELPGEKSTIPFSYSDGRYLITLNRDLGTYWLMLK